MADLDVQQTDNIDPQAAAAAELHQFMEQAGVVAPKAADPATTTAAATTTTAAAPTETPFTFDALKEKFGFDKPESVFSEIENLRAFKAAPPVAEPKFENDFSKNVYNLLKAGKTDDVYNIMAQQKNLEKVLGVELNKDSAAEVVKFGMQQRYKDLTPAEIDYKFKKQFSIPAKPVQSANDDAEDFKAKMTQWEEVVNDRNMDLMIEAKTLRPELEAAKAKLVFPEIPTSADQEYLDYKKSIEENAKLSDAAIQAYKAFTAATVETKLPFADKVNGVELEFHHMPDAASFGQAQEMASDINKFYAHFTKADGTPDREAFIKFIYNGINTSRMLTAAMDQSKNATLISMLPDNAQRSGLVRQLTQTVEESDVDKQMAQAGIKRTV